MGNKWQLKAAELTRKIGVEATRETFDRLVYEFDRWLEFGDIIGARSTLSSALIVGLSAFDDDAWLRDFLRERMLACGMHPGMPTENIIQEYEDLAEALDGADITSLSEEYAQLGSPIQDMLDVMVRISRLKLTADPSFLSVLGNASKRETNKLAIGIRNDPVDGEMRAQIKAVCDYFDGVYMLHNINNPGYNLAQKVMDIASKHGLDFFSPSDDDILALKFATLMVGFYVAVYMGFFSYEDAKKVSDDILQIVESQKPTIMPVMEIVVGRYMRGGVFGDNDGTSNQNDAIRYMFSPDEIRWVFRLDKGVEK